MKNCKMCKRKLDDPKDPTTEDCGGDCLRCMAMYADDPDCISAMRTISVNEFGKDLAEIAAKQLVKFKHVDDRDDLMYQLQDATSLFSPYIADMIARKLKEMKK